uniref:Macaca fascicularis brain cDNA clone: QmoA-10876, similar to human junctional adhesion molecule 3 (JAM3), mRNA, RefSeq: NM_032801.3 n=1 Tax=Macaca fascicularis TaxID=9541 RepID=I7GJR9_MACFA|nr:unnamed protein product [Macaca fascicularis]
MYRQTPVSSWGCPRRPRSSTVLPRYLPGGPALVGPWQWLCPSELDSHGPCFIQHSSKVGTPGTLVSSTLCPNFGLP